jgi:hypothetical protein
VKYVKLLFVLAFEAAFFTAVFLLVPIQIPLRKAMCYPAVAQANLTFFSIKRSSFFFIVNCGWTHAANA